jgi:ubiquinone/menaquinone biosynthesis C-methylase UbiE
MSLATVARDPSAPQARFWDRIARQYALDPVADPAGYERTLQRVIGLLRPSFDVLEVGCGTGTTALRLAPHVRQWRATDVSAEMLKVAREKWAMQPMATLQFELAEAETTRFSAERHDVVTAFNVLHLMQDLDRTLASLKHTLKPGGLLISKTPCVAEMNPLIPWLAVPLMQLVGKAPPVKCFDGPHLLAAFERRGLRIEAAELHGSKGRDIRHFVVARKVEGR